MYQPQLMYPIEFWNKKNPVAPRDHDQWILAQGDSWFSIGAIPFCETANILMELALSKDTGIFNVAYPGKLLRDMVIPARSPDFHRALTENGAFPWSAILLSGGGNDLIDFLQQDVNSALGDRVLLHSGEWSSAPGVRRYLSSAGLYNLKQQITSALQTLAGWRQQHCPTARIIAHTYAYPIPRPVGPGLLLDSKGWFYAAYEVYGIPLDDRVELTRVLIDETAQVLIDQAQAIGHFDVVETRRNHTRGNILIPAGPAAPGPSGDWVNEIHPTRTGYSKLAEIWQTVL